jgi:hypothetical protein
MPHQRDTERRDCHGSTRTLVPRLCGYCESILAIIPLRRRTANFPVDIESGSRK